MVLLENLWNKANNVKNFKKNGILRCYYYNKIQSKEELKLVKVTCFIELFVNDVNVAFCINTYKLKWNEIRSTSHLY